MNAPTSADTPTWVVVDVETTGLSPQEHRIVEIAVVVLDERGEPLGEAATLLDPDVEVDPTHGHGIRPEDVLGAPRFPEIAGWLIRWLAGKVLVGHNLLFAVAFLEEEFERAGIEMPHVPAICTMTHAPRYLPDAPGRSLEQCCAAAGVSIGTPRSALTNARAAGALFSTFLGQRSQLRSPWVDFVTRARRMEWPQVPVRHFPMTPRPLELSPLDPSPLSGEPEEEVGTPEPADQAGELFVAVAEEEVRPGRHADGGDTAGQRDTAGEPDTAGQSDTAGRFSTDGQSSDIADQLATAVQAPQADDAGQTDNAGQLDTADQLGAAGELEAEVDAVVNDPVGSFSEAIRRKDLDAALAAFEAEQVESHQAFLRELDETLRASKRGRYRAEVGRVEVADMDQDTGRFRRPEGEQENPRQAELSHGNVAVAVDQITTEDPDDDAGARSTPVAGWYPDPRDGARLRWWDGKGWTEHTHVR